MAVLHRCPKARNRRHGRNAAASLAMQALAAQDKGLASADKNIALTIKTLTRAAAAAEVKEAADAKKEARAERLAQKAAAAAAAAAAPATAPEAAASAAAVAAAAPEAAAAAATPTAPETTPETALETAPSGGSEEEAGQADEQPAVGMDIDADEAVLIEPAAGRVEGQQSGVGQTSVAAVAALAAMVT